MKKITNEITKAPVVYLDALDLRNFDDYTFRHSVNVAALSLVIGLGENYSYEDLVELCVAALFYDKGKMRLDKDILEKTQKLTVQEIEVIKSHPHMSYNMVSERWSISPKIQAGILCHHENEDGSGYPLGLTGDKIHPFAKIIHVADVYDALISKRPYKGAYSSSESVKTIMSCRNEQAADFILKPFKASYLKQRIRVVLGEE